MQTAGTSAAATKSWWRRIVGAAILIVALVFLAAHGWAYLHFRAAQRAGARRDFAAARAHADACAKVWFHDPDVRLLRVRNARRAGDLNRADDLLRASRRDGELTDALGLESKLLTAQRGELHRVEDSLLGAVRDGHKDSALILEVLTPAYYHTYQLVIAQECVNRWLECEPETAAAWLWRARIYERLRDRTETIVSLGRVVELDPDNDEARLALARHLTDSRQPQSAMEQFVYLRARLGDVPAVLAGLAQCYVELNRPDEARVLLDRLLADDPHNGRLLHARGRLVWASESAAAAEPWFRRAAAALPYERDIIYSLFQCVEQLGKRDEARDLLARLNKIDADRKRMRELTLAVANSPHDPELRYQAGLVFLRNGQEYEGVRWLQSALAEAPSHAPTHQALADYYARTGNRDTADRHRRLAGR
jgi:predicted Zn-dependent protease